MDKFLEFQRRLQNEILALEFKRKSAVSPSKKLNNEDTISEKDFADLLIAYAGFPSKKKTKMLKRVRKEFHQDEDSSPGITLKDFLSFYQVIKECF